MSRERTFLERLARPDAERDRTAREDPAVVVRSVLDNLQRILNSRVGHAPAQPDLGMPAPSDLVRFGAEAGDWIADTLKACIEKYEPRLADVQVARLENEDGSLALRFQVSARLAAEKTEVPVSFDTRVDPAGRIRVRE
jgi:type VI secretion system protein